MVCNFDEGLCGAKFSSSFIFFFLGGSVFVRSDGSGSFFSFSGPPMGSTEPYRSSIVPAVFYTLPGPRKFHAVGILGFDSWVSSFVYFLFVFLTDL